MKQKMNQGRLNPLYPKKEKVLTVVGAFFVATLERVSVFRRNHCPACKVRFLDGKTSADVLCLKSKHEIENLQGFTEKWASCILRQSSNPDGLDQNVPFGGNSLKSRYNMT